MKKHVLLLFILISLIAFLVSCSGDNNARLQVRLTDAPGDYQEVNVEILGVEVHASTGEQKNGWKTLNVNKGIYNLLELTNGLDTLLGEIELPSGMISQIRLKLGDNNSIKVNDKVLPLATPSGQQSGLKLQVHQVLAEGITYTILLDFDVARSVIQTGNGDYKLKPVIRTITKATDGAIKGIVDPAAATPAIFAIMNTDTVATTFSDSTGHFLIRGLRAGSYKVAFVPNSNFEKVEKTAEVKLGAVTDLGTVNIPE